MTNGSAITPVTLVAVEGSKAAQVLMCLHEPKKHSAALIRSADFDSFENLPVANDHGDTSTAWRACGSIHGRDATLMILPRSTEGKPLGMPNTDLAETVALVDESNTPRGRMWGQLPDSFVRYYYPWAKGSTVYFVRNHNEHSGPKHYRVFVPRKVAENLAALLCRPATPKVATQPELTAYEQPAQLGIDEVCVGAKNWLPAWTPAEVRS